MQTIFITFFSEFLLIARQKFEAKEKTRIKAYNGWCKRNWWLSYRTVASYATVVALSLTYCAQVTTSVEL